MWLLLWPRRAWVCFLFNFLLILINGSLFSKMSTSGTITPGILSVCMPTPLTVLKIKSKMFVLFFFFCFLFLSLTLPLKWDCKWCEQNSTVKNFKTTSIVDADGELVYVGYNSDYNQIIVSFRGFVFFLSLFIFSFFLHLTLFYLNFPHPKTK